MATQTIENQERIEAGLLENEPFEAGLFEFHHVGVAVRNLEAALEVYTEGFGLRQVSDPIEVPGQHVRVCFVKAPPGVLIELVEGIGDSSPVKEILERTGAGTYHMCFQVDDLDATLIDLKQKGFFRLKVFEQSFFGRRRFAFMLTPDRSLFELCEKARDEQGLGS